MPETPTHRAVSEDGTEIIGRVHGQGPPLVLVPGAMGDGETLWEPLLPHLCERFTCFTPSTRNRGLSGRSDDLSPDRLIEDVTAFADSIGEDVGLMGWSQGGMLSLGAAERTDAITAVATFEPAVLPVIDDQTMVDVVTAVERQAELAEEGRMVDAARTFLEAVCIADELTEAADSGLLERLAPNIPTHLQEMQHLGGADGPGPTDPSELSKVAVPAALLQGTRSIPWFVDGVRHVADHVADADVREVDGAGHLGPYLEPDGVAAELTPFFAEVLAPS
jgi:pimeloyl-ACP methyl ester carboxylesterase